MLPSPLGSADTLLKKWLSKCCEESQADCRRKYHCAIRGCRCLARSFKIERRTQIAPRSTSEVAFRVLTLKTNGIWHNSTMPTLAISAMKSSPTSFPRGKTADEAYELAGYVRNSIEGRRKDQGARRRASGTRRATHADAGHLPRRRLADEPYRPR